MSKSPLTDEWIKSIWSMYIPVEYYLSIKKDEIIPFAPAWMGLEMITLSKVSQKDKYPMISLTCGI